MSSTERLVVLYHYVTEEAGFKGVTPALFREHLRFLKREGYAPVTVAAMASWLREGKELPRRSVCITFDDGLRCQHAEALPILREEGFSACFFLSTANMLEGKVLGVHKAHLLLAKLPPRRIGALFERLTGDPIPEDRRLNPAKRWDDIYVANLKHLLHSLPETLDRIFAEFYSETAASRDLYLGLPEAKALLDAGMEIGSHTMHHVFLSRLTESEQFRELSGSKELLERHLGTRIDSISYPSGSYDERTLRLAESLYSTGFTVKTEENTGRTPPLEINRLDANHVTERLRAGDAAPS